MNLRSGTRLGPYEIVAPLGAGGMGEVYKARDTRLGRAVAVKILPAEFASDAKLKLRFEREAKAISSLNHPHICTLHDVGQGYLVMELCEGKTLAQKLESGALPIDQVLDFGVQIADALDKAHRKGIIHRDLKPSNIMLTKSGVKLLDFGLAKQVTTVGPAAGTQTSTVDQPLTGDSVIAGTLQYMAPETLTHGQVDARSDIYALGLVLYEMIGGRPAFHADSRAKLVAAILEHEPQPVSSGNADLDHVVARCLRKDPDERWQSTADIAEELRWIKMRATSGPVARRTKPLLWMTVLLACAVVALGSAILVSRLRTSKPPIYERITYRRGVVTHARFAPDGRTVVFAAAWDADPLRIFVKRPESDDAAPLDIPPADLLSVSRSGELAILLSPRFHVPFGMTIGRLARVPMNGGVPRPIVENVIAADWAADGRSIAIIRDTGREQRVEIRSADGGELIRQLYVNATGMLGHVRFSPQGERVAFTSTLTRSNAAQNPVMVVNAEGGAARVLGSTVAFADIVWSPDGRELWFPEGVREQSEVHAVSLSGRTRAIFQAPGTFWFDDVAGDSVLVAQNDMSAHIFCRTATATADRDITPQNWAAPFHLTADGKRVLVRNSTALKSELVSLDGSSRVAITDDIAFAFTADEQAVLVRPRAGRPSDLALVPLSTGERKMLPPTNVDAVAGAATTPNGQSIILIGVINNVMHLYEKSILGTAVRRITDEPIYFPWVAVSPDSSSVAVTGPTQRLTVYGVATGAASIVPTSVPGDYPITYASDGSLLFTRTGKQRGYLYRFDFRAQREQLVREIVPVDRAGVLWASPNVGSASPDAKAYCYQCGQVLSRLIIAHGLMP